MKDRFSETARRARLLFVPLLAALGLSAPAVAETQKIAPNPEYEASGLHEFWLGKGYRDPQYSPEAWDLEEDFGGVQGSVSGYLGLGETERVVLAARVGGRQTFGKYPWYAAAFIGGSGSNRGFREQRFAGDQSFYGNFELRLRAIDRMKVIPGRLWLVGLADFGRVWLEGEDSDDWHPSYGGGIAFEVAGAPMTFWTGAAKGEGSDGLRFYFGSGFGS